MGIRIGITGGIGSGKSVVSRLLRLLGIPVYISDEEAKRLMATDEGIRAELVALLASYLFAGPDHARRVNAIVHPRVRDDFRAWAKAHEGAGLVAMESAILYEAGFRDEVDRVVMVYAPEETRIERATRRDAASRAGVEKRIRSQMGDEEKRRLADYVLVNDGKRPLIPQVLALISSLSQNH